MTRALPEGLALLPGVAFAGADTLPLGAALSSGGLPGRVRPSPAGRPASDLVGGTADTAGRAGASGVRSPGLAVSDADALGRGVG
ncbi:hypothetical protein [Streptomyces hypolithicus]